MIEELAEVVHILSGFCRVIESFNIDGLRLWEAKWI